MKKHTLTLSNTPAQHLQNRRLRVQVLVPLPEWHFVIVEITECFSFLHFFIQKAHSSLKAAGARAWIGLNRFFSKGAGGVCQAPVYPASEQKTAMVDRAFRKGANQAAKSLYSLNAA